MAESTLSIAYADLQSAVAIFAGWDLTPGNWDANQSAQFALILPSGLRRFYSGIASPTQDAQGRPKFEPSHEWSFLAKTATISTSLGTYAYTLPDNFSGVLIDESFVVQLIANTPAVNTTKVTEEAIRSMRANAALTGSPKFYCVRAKTLDATVGLRYEVVFYPTPDAVYSIDYRYVVNPEVLDGTNKYPYGGAQYSELIRESVLAAAESILDDDFQGVHEQRFQQLLMAAIRADRENKEAANTGFDPNNVPGEFDNFATIQRQVGDMLGFGSNPAMWGLDQISQVKTIIDAGYTNYLYPPVVDNGQQPHEWSFLKPTGEIHTSSGQRFYSLPPDFDRFCGGLTYGDDQNVYREINVVPEHRLRVLENQLHNTSFPLYAAVRPTASSGVLAQHQELVLHPTPSQEYVLTFQYHATQRRLTSDAPYPLGGPIHAAGVLLSCLAEAELFKNKAAGSYRQKFMERLTANIASDLRRGPQVLGYNGNGNRGIDPGRSRNRNAIYYRDVTYNGSGWNS